MAESIKKFIIKDAHGGTKESGSFSVVGEVHVNLVPGYGEPYAESEYVNGILTITIHNIEGNGITEITTDSQEGDEAVNTVTIKTNSNPEGVVLEVRNGSKGETGNTGPQGRQGDSAIWTGEGELWSGLKNTTGQSTTEPMTQKAVTEALVTNSASFVLDGLGGDNNNSILFKLKAGQTYRLSLSKTTWENSASAGVAIFSIGKYVNDEWSALYTVTKGNAAKSEYIVAAESNATEYTIAIRADVGEQIEITVDDITHINTGVEAHIIGDSYTDVYNYSSGYRYYIRLKKEIQTPFVLRLRGDIPEGVQWGFEGFTTLADMTGTTAYSTEGSPFGVEKQYVFEKSSYARVVFKKGSGSLTSAQIASIRQNAILEVVSLLFDNAKGVVLKNANEMVYPITPSKGVLHGGTTLDQYLDGMALILPYAMSDMAKSSPIASRRRYTVKVPIIPFYVSVEGTPPNGMSWYVGTNYSLSDAQSSSVENVESVGWGEPRSAYFSSPDAYYLTIGWKKSNNGNFSADDISALEASGIKLVVKNFSIGENDSSDIIDLNGKAETLTYLRNAKRPQYKGSSYTPTTTPCTLLHFSDIHADEPNMKRIVEFYNYYKAYINDALCTGDIIKNLFGDSFAFWGNAEAASILNCAGNHEYYNGESSAPYYKQITQKQVYDKFFAPYIEDWGVTQPANAEENGLNYYYKDYTTSKVRLIVLDNFRVDAYQLQWFEDVLADAITNDLHVIAAMHIGNPVGWVKYDNPFNSLRENNPSSANGWVFDDSELLYDKVDEFIGNNGVFVGWLMGHRHSDAIGTPYDHPNQLEIHVATASCGNSWDIIPKGDNCDRTVGTKSQDCFNIYSIDTYYHMIRIHRIGSDVDRDFRHIGNLCYDYINHQVIYFD